MGSKAKMPDHCPACSPLPLGEVVPVLFAGTGEGNPVAMN